MDHERQRSALVTNLWQEEGGAVVKVHVALTVEAAPAVFQHVIHTEHVHGLVVLEESGVITDVHMPSARPHHHLTPRT